MQLLISVAARPHWRHVPGGSLEADPAGAGRQVQVDPFIIGFEVTTQYGAIKLGEREWIRTIADVRSWVLPRFTPTARRCACPYRATSPEAQPLHSCIRAYLARNMQKIPNSRNPAPMSPTITLPNGSARID